jgi:hypothetical protein
VRHDLEHSGLDTNRGIVFAEDCGQATRRAFCELPILVVN